MGDGKHRLGKSNPPGVGRMGDVKKKETFHSTRKLLERNYWCGGQEGKGASADTHPSRIVAHPRWGKAGGGLNDPNLGSEKGKYICFHNFPPSAGPQGVRGSEGRSRGINPILHTIHWGGEGAADLLKKPGKETPTCFLGNR